MTINSLPPSDDEDEVWLFERIVDELQREYACSQVDAVDLLNRYHSKFTDPDYCAAYDMCAQTTEFFCREESKTMADRVYYHEALGNEPNEEGFIRWQRARRLR